MSNPRFTPGPWMPHVMTHAERGDLLTPEELGEYVKNSVIKSAGASGTTEFVFVSADLVDGPADICHVGNGPNRGNNASLVAAAPDLYAALRLMVEWHGALHLGDCSEDDTCSCPGKAVNDAVNAAIAKAEGRS